MNHNEIIKNEIRFFLDVDIIDRNCIQFPEHVIHQIINVLKKKLEILYLFLMENLKNIKSFWTQYLKLKLKDILKKNIIIMGN